MRNCEWYPGRHRTRENPTTSKSLPSHLPVWVAGFAMRYLPEVYGAVVRFSNGEQGDACYTSYARPRRTG